MERKLREKELETPRCYVDDNRTLRAHCEFDKPSRRNEEPKWGKAFAPERGKAGGQDGGVLEAAEKPAREPKPEDGPAPRKERVRNKVLPLVWDPPALIRPC